MFTYTAEILPYHDHPFEESVRRLASLGFTEINLWSSAAPLGHHVNPGDDPAEILRILDKYGVRPCGLTTYGKNQDEILERVEFAGGISADFDLVKGQFRVQGIDGFTGDWETPETIER